MTTKEQFIDKEPELCASLASVTHSTWFEKCLTYVDSLVFQEAEEKAFITGARRYKEILMTLADRDETLTRRQPQPGLVPMGAKDLVLPSSNQQEPPKPKP